MSAPNRENALVIARQEPDKWAPPERSKAVLAELTGTGSVMVWYAFNDEARHDVIVGISQKVRRTG